MSLRNVPIDEVEPGSTLGDNVHDRGGHILLRAGTLLTESVMESLRRRDIVELPVDVGEVIDAAQREALRFEAERRLAMAFRMAGEGQASQMLRQATLELMLEQIL